MKSTEWKGLRCIKSSYQNLIRAPKLIILNHSIRHPRNNFYGNDSSLTFTSKYSESKNVILSGTDRNVWFN